MDPTWAQMGPDAGPYVGHLGPYRPPGPMDHMGMYGPSGAHKRQPAGAAGPRAAALDGPSVNPAANIRTAQYLGRAPWSGLVVCQL
jgi:hypothetical protein